MTVDARKGQNVNMLFGRDQFLLSAVAYGCRGAVGTTYNFNADLQRIVLNANDNGDWAMARAAMRGTSSFVKAIQDVENIVGGAYVWKMIATEIGLDVGPARLPYIPPTAEATAAVKTMLAEWCGSLTKTLKPWWCAKVFYG